ncbi:hypothetical protein T01_5674 [Trichinella spiralis]|uniref:Uncharacterized protein n=1 Tax=Trichinella spiralis TaxID=6334 RepID=A0A0V1AI90_TRISP|nr:hypothetical protein T01_5674 [Trichinella spiralis]
MQAQKDLFTKKCIQIHVRYGGEGMFIVVELENQIY